MKKTNFQTFSLLSTLTTAVLLSACGGNNGPQTVEIEFAAVAGSTKIQCGTTITGLGVNSIDAELKDFRFYISNASMVRADGSEEPITLVANDNWNYTSGTDRVTLIDLEDATGSCPTATGTAGTNTKLKGTVAAGDYTGVKMTMGVPFALNHTLYSDTATAKPPLDIQALAWSWQGGRKFAKIEVTQPTGATWTAPTFNVHLGSTGCQGNPATGTQVSSCNAPNRMDFKLSAFNPNTQVIAVDIKNLLAGTDITVNQASAAGCMSGGTDPECVNVFSALAIDWSSAGTGTGLPVNGGAAQTLFRAIAK